MITEDQVDEALELLRTGAVKAAKAHAERVYMQEFRKTVKAQIMQEHDRESGIVQEREAYADPRYIRHLEALRDAIFLDEKESWATVAAKATLEAFKTQSWNERAMKL